MKSRKVVTRSGRGFRGYFPSKKLNRMVQFESLLERDAIYLFEFSPGIVSYREQPELILYEYECKTRKYYPDFEVIFKAGRPLHVEVKPEQKLKCPKLADKFKAIHQRYQSHDANFLIFTEELIRQKPLLSNLKTIAKVRNHLEDIGRIVVTAEGLLKGNPNLSFNAFSQRIGYPKALLLLARHRVFCDLYQKLTSPSNFVRLPKETDHDTVYF